MVIENKAPADGQIGGSLPKRKSQKYFTKGNQPMKSRTQKRRPYVAHIQQRQPKKEINVRPLAWALIGAFGLLMLSHILAGCTPIPAQAQPLPYPTPYPTGIPYTIPDPAPTRAHPRPEETEKTRVAIVSTGYENGNANIRSCPSKACSVLAIVREGDEIQIIGTANQWLNVQAGDVIGYIYKILVEVTK